ncbi:MAG: hypothetical protein AB2L11_10140 [Syntrophobacteraceae bacterium]
MESNLFRYILFPHSSLTEPQFRHLSILLPSLSIVQIIKPPTVPMWARQHFPILPVVHEPHQLEQIRNSIKGYQELGSLYGEECAPTLLSHQNTLDESRETRIGIQGALRNREAEVIDPKQLLQVEAATFFEIAMELDERERELEASFNRVNVLEDEFRRIIGITEEDHPDDSLKDLTPPLTTGRASISYLLSRRMRSCFRLFSNLQLAEKPILVTILEDAAATLIDRLQVEYEQVGKTLPINKLTLASIPALDHLSNEAFLALTRELNATDLSRSYRLSLEEILGAPYDVNYMDQFARDLGALQARIQSSEFNSHVTGQERRVSLNLIYIADCALGDLWKALDTKGYSLLEKQQFMEKRPAIFLSLVEDFQYPDNQPFNLA